MLALRGLAVWLCALPCLPLVAQRPALLKPLAVVAQDLIAAGQGADAGLVVAVLEQCGYEAKALAKLREAIATPLAKPRPPKPPARLAAALRRAVAALAPELQRLDGEARTRLATAMLALDEDVAAAQAVFGRERHGNDWLDATALACRQRQQQIDDAVLQALRLDFPITAVPTTHELFTKVGIAQPTRLEFGAMTVISEWPPDKAKRALRTFAQGAALSRWLLGGKLEFTPRACRYLHFAQHTRYAAAVAELQRQGAFDQQEAAAVLSLHAFDPPGGWRFEQDITEGAFATALLYDDSYYRIKQAWLLGGHVDWIGRALIGAPLGQYAFEEKAQTVAGGTGVDWLKERFGKAGLAGARIWMRRLAEQRQDPPWSRAFVESVGMIPFEALIKCTLVHEYLCQRQLLATLVDGPRQPGPFRERVGEATGEGYELFDDSWRRWLLAGSGRSLFERLNGPDPALPDVAEDQALQYLRRLREQALARQLQQEPVAPAVGFDRELSDGCKLHAKYLQQNRDQLARWPDAHEEYPDRPGFSAAGAFAGTHSVITGAGDMHAAIDAWMATFYHRVPLVDPGLVSVGFALDGGIAVLDAGSMCMPSDASYLASMWPPPDGTGVPLHFQPEMPNPVPGEDQAAWGYPVTLQYHLPDPYDPGSVTMTLQRGDAEVPCWFSSPVAPTNGEIAPADVYCLIPKAALLAKTRYHVVVARGGTAVTDWSFTTQ